MLFGCPTINFGPLLRGQPHSSNVNHCVLHFQPEGHREPGNMVGSLIPSKHLMGFEARTFRFLLQRLNPLGHTLVLAWLTYSLWLKCLWHGLAVTSFVVVFVCLYLWNICISHNSGVQPSIPQFSGAWNSNLLGVACKEERVGKNIKGVP